ncbi:MAG: NAD(P)H-quinone oxidoreductase subunit 2, chloroplastic [Candidatus Omnitrophica bacterium]|nr:NAD(P)H-quinone oxidoreductase subunit 2, chloroplastic [Candidatus Omnitrophota bacterium]
MDLTLLWTIQLAPLAVFALIFILPKNARGIAPLLGLTGSAAAAVSALCFLLAHAGKAGQPALHYSVDWLTIDLPAAWPLGKAVSGTLKAGFLLDPLNLLMITLVTVISFFVQLFSFYYMREDESRPRYFAYLSFFSFAMTGLVLASNLLQTFMFWELVGLASYLLIGFWYTKPSAAQAARKAFVLNRLGDLGFYLGIVILFVGLGTLDFTGLGKDAVLSALGPTLAMAAGLLVLTGVMGKSAQFPLHIWLPDAMEGPTPVSALIHSATMVAAGVFLLVRAYGVFSASEVTLEVILLLGCVTGLIGALLATRQRDIKKILAYSTVSQLGLMAAGVGAHAPQAAMFHLTTHAFFKSCLFLTSGAFIHRFHSNDIWTIARGGGRKDLVPMLTLTVGLLSLCGLPPLSGFFSKDLILEAAKHHGLAAFAACVAVSVLTAYYSFRLLFIVLFARPTAGHGHGHHAHGHDAGGHHEDLLGGLSRALPLLLLAALSIYAGFLGSPMTHSPILVWLGGHEAHFDPAMAVKTLVIIAVGCAIAFALHRDPDASEKKLESSKGPWAMLVDRRFFIDDAFVWVTKQVGLRIASFFDLMDRWLVNGVLVNGTSYRIADLGRLAVRLQSGSLQGYLACGLAVLAVTLLWLTGGSSR